MRKLLRKIIMWALRSSEPVEHDAAGMDMEARRLRNDGSAK